MDGKGEFGGGRAGRVGDEPIERAVRSQEKTKPGEIMKILSKNSGKKAIVVPVILWWLGVPLSLILILWLLF